MHIGQLLKENKSTILSIDKHKISISSSLNNKCKKIASYLRIFMAIILTFAFLKIFCYKIMISAFILTILLLKLSYGNYKCYKCEVSSQLEQPDEEDCLEVGPSTPTCNTTFDAGCVTIKTRKGSNRILTRSCVNSYAYPLNLNASNICEYVRGVDEESLCEVCRWRSCNYIPFTIAEINVQDPSKDRRGGSENNLEESTGKNDEMFVKAVANTNFSSSILYLLSILICFVWKT